MKKIACNVFCCLSLVFIAAASARADFTPGKSPVEKAPGTKIASASNIDSHRFESIFVKATTQDEIREVLADLVTFMVSPGGLNKIDSLLAKENRGNYKKASDADVAALNAAIKDFNAEWQNTYHGRFHLGAILGIGSGKTDVEKLFRYDYLQGKDPEHVAVLVPASEDLPQVRFMVVNEGMIKNSWKVSTKVPVTADELSRKITNELTAFLKNKSSWPLDESQCYDLLSHRVLALIGETDSSQQ